METPRHTELSSADEEMLHALAPDEETTPSGPEGIHKRVIPGEPESYEDAVADVVRADRANMTEADRRRDSLSLESKAVYKRIEDTFADLKRRATGKPGTPEFVTLAEQAMNAWKRFVAARTGFESGQVDEEEFRLVMQSVLPELDNAREQLLPNE